MFLGVRSVYLLSLAYLAPRPSVALSVQQQYLGPSQPIPNPNTTGRNISTTLFAELEELSRVVDIAYCVGAAGIGIQKPFTCLGRCAEFPNFELVQVSALSSPPSDLRSALS